MKKKILSLVLAFCMIIPCSLMFAGCEKPTFATTWTFNETHHWHASTKKGSDEKADYAEHVDSNEDEVCDVCLHGAVALVGTTAYANLETAITSACDAYLEAVEVAGSADGVADVVVSLFDNIELVANPDPLYPEETNRGIYITNAHITLKLNGKTITAENWDGFSIFCVDGMGSILTIEGEGTINSASQVNDYSMAVWARNGGEIIIKGGTFTNVGAKAFEDNGTTPNNNELIYASGGSQINITGGTFIGNHENTTHGVIYTLNQHDEGYDTILVSGGRFYAYNPSEVVVEPEVTTYVGTGYKAVQDGDYYVVVAE